MLDKILNLIHPSRAWEPHQMIVAGTRPATQEEISSSIQLQPGEVAFVLIATRDGSMEGQQYVSQTFYSEPDDIWLNGAVDGKPVTVRINSKNPEQYKVITSGLRPFSQYS